MINSDTKGRNKEEREKESEVEKRERKGSKERGIVKYILNRTENYNKFLKMVVKKNMQVSRLVQETHVFNIVVITYPTSWQTGRCDMGNVFHKFLHLKDDATLAKL